MPLLTIPLVAVPSQTLAVQLGDQPCTIDLYQKTTGLYFDLAVADVPVVVGALCQDRNWLIWNGYKGFRGDMAFVDAQGTADPSYEGLAGRFELYWYALDI